MTTPLDSLGTIPQQFMEKVRRYGDRKVAVRQKELGIWQEFTWQMACEQVRDFAMGLVALGMQPGDRVSIVGDNDRQYLWSDIAITTAGGVVVGLFTDSNPNEMEYVITHSGATFALAKDQEQCDKHLDIKDKIPKVKKVIYWDPRGMWSYDDDWLMSFKDVQALGRKLHDEQPDLFDRLVAQGKTDDLAMLCYTSGTTGLPKGAMLTHQNLLAASRGYEISDPRRDTDDVISFTPLAWIAENTLAVTPHVMYGITVNFPEAPETVQANIREIAPAVIFYPSRLWENLTASIQIRINDTTWFNRLLYNLFLPIGYRVADRHYEKKPVGLPLRLLYWLGDLLVFKPMRNQLGFVNVRSAITAGASLSPDMLRFFRAMGINLKQVYALTETAAAGTQHMDEDVKFASVGVPHLDAKVKITPEGEICMGGPNVFVGYYQNEQATREALEIDEDGTRWFHTGDAGYVDEDGHLIYLDRMKDMIELASGEKYSPQFIEGRLKFSPYIRDAMTIGSYDVEYVTALISIDFDNVGRWAEKQRIPYTTFVDLSQKPEVYDLIRQDVARVNETLPPGGRVRKFVLLHKEFDADESEITRTRKLRRGFLTNRYGDMIDSMYGGKDAVRVSAAIRYQDGREGVIETEVRVMTLDQETTPT